MRIAFLLAVLLAATAASAEYAGLAAWNEDANTLGFQIDAFDKCRGRLAEKARFSGCIRMWEDAYRRWWRMDGHARAPLEKEPGNLEAAALAERSKDLGEKLDGATAFLQPEVRKLGRAKVSQLLATQKSLARYKEPLDLVLRAKPDAPVDARSLFP